MKKNVLIPALSVAAFTVFLGIKSMPDEEPQKAEGQVTSFGLSGSPLSSPFSTAHSPVSEPMPESFSPSIPALSSPPSRPEVCPVTKTVNHAEIIQEINFQRSLKDRDPLQKFKHLFNSYYDRAPESYGELGITQPQYMQNLQQAAGAAFNQLIQQYPHAKLQQLDQAADIKEAVQGRSLETLMQIHALRWSMSNLIVNLNGPSRESVDESRIVGGVDMTLLNDLVAKLSIGAFPEVVEKLRGLPQLAVLNEDQFEQYEMYLQILEYVSTGSAFSQINQDRPEWADLGFDKRQDWIKLKNDTRSHLLNHEAKFAQSMIEACKPADRSLQPS